MDHDQLREKYRLQFVAREYPNQVASRSFLRYFHQRELHSIFHLLPERTWSLLDVGCGPTTYNVFPATRYTQDVVLSDYLPSNRLEVEKWLENAPDAEDWSCYSESLAMLEGFSDLKRRAEEITRRTRSAVRKVIPCDVLVPGVLPEEHREKFDVVLSSLCLESACLDEAAFSAATQNVGGLVQEGGLLILCGVLGSSGYTVGGIKFPTVYLKPGIVKNALMRAGFQIKRWRSLDDSDSPVDSPFVVVAEKPGSAIK